jgi:SAM-dependent methyltransferase
MWEVLHRLHHELDDRHWWFAARRRIVLQVLDAALRRAGPAGKPRILDIGCGGGGTLRELALRGEAFGLDPEPSAVEAAMRRARCEVRLGRLPDEIPYELGSFDAVTLLDVLEHIEDDVRALGTIERLLRPGGLLLCTVPAYRFLWSQHDDVNEHRRRYTRPELRIRLEAAGLRVRKLSYCNTFLFPPIAAARLLWRRGGRPPGVAGGAAVGASAALRSSAEPAANLAPVASPVGSAADRADRAARPDLGDVPGPLNAVLRAIFGAERHWLRVADFPFGVSVLALAQKPGGKA